MDRDTTNSRPAWLADRRGATAGPRLGLVVAWSASEPDRIGEIALVPEETDHLLGRGPPVADDPHPRLRFAARRPGQTATPSPLEGARISRRQLRVRNRGDALEVEKIGRCALRIGGAPTKFGVVRPGDTLLLEDALLLYCVRRDPEDAALASSPIDTGFPFGGPDAHGIVGESPACWTMRSRIAFAASRDEHVLLLGPSGSGKELAARAIHDMSRRSAGPFVARNATTLPHGLIDAELFGHAQDYPSPGMPQRPGLIGRAHGGTLFLDEIGELSQELQAHLLRVLDREGEYQRLGDAQPQRANLRLVAATNRPDADLKADVAARMLLRVDLPGMDARGEDVPLLVRHLLRRAAADDASIARAFFDGWDGARGVPRIDPSLMEALLRHRYDLHVRELESLLLCAIGSSRDYVGLTSEVERRLRPLAPAELPAGEVTPLRIRAVLDKHGGNQERAWRELGLKNRDVLYRLMKKHSIAPRRARDDE